MNPELRRLATILGAVALLGTSGCATAFLELARPARSAYEQFSIVKEREHAVLQVPARPLTAKEMEGLGTLSSYLLLLGTPVIAFGAGFAAGAGLASLIPNGQIGGGVAVATILVLGFGIWGADAVGALSRLASGYRKEFPFAVELRVRGSDRAVWRRKLRDLPAPGTASFEVAPWMLDAPLSLVAVSTHGASIRSEDIQFPRSEWEGAAYPDAAARQAARDFPGLALARIAVAEVPGGSPQEPLRLAVELALANRGAHDAEAVQVTLVSGDARIAPVGSPTVGVGTIPAGATRGARLDLVVENGYDGPPKLPMVAICEERRAGGLRIFTVPVLLPGAN